MTRHSGGGPVGHKKQHFVPQFCLRPFAASSGRIAVFDKTASKVFWGRPEDIGHQNNFLSIPELDRGAGNGTFFESFFGKLETEAASAIAEIFDRSRHGVVELVAPHSRRAIAKFLAVQHRRTPEARARIGQLRAKMDHVLRELREEGTDQFKKWVDAGVEKEHDPVLEHSRQILSPQTIAHLANVLYEHIWLVFAAPTGVPLYSSDHPLAIHSHVRDEHRGYGPASFGTEIQFPLSPCYLLCLYERRWVAQSAPGLVTLDGQLAGSLVSENVIFQRSLQVRESQRFLYCSVDDYDLAREMCSTHSELRDPNRPRVVAYHRGREV